MLAIANSHELARGPIEEDERDGAPAYRGDDRDEGEQSVVPDEHWQIEREHADEVHAPYSQAKGQRAAAAPKNAAAATGDADALSDLDGDVGAEGRDNERKE